MFRKIIEMLKTYGERNLESHEKLGLVSPYAPDGVDPIRELNPELNRKLREEVVEELYALEIENDDLTPIEFVRYLTNKDK